MMHKTFDVVVTGPSAFALSGELDVDSVALFAAATAPAVERGGLLMLDFSRLTFLDSAGLRSIVRMTRALPSGCIVAHGVTGTPLKIFSIAGLMNMPTLHVIPCAELLPPRDGMRP
jgi:anti-anti-sigma factor